MIHTPDGYRNNGFKGCDMYRTSDLVVLKKQCNFVNLMRFVMEFGLGLVLGSILLGNGGEVAGDNGVMLCI